MLVYIAAIQNIPESLIDAADVDGASVFQKIRHVVWPLVAPAFTIAMFITLSGSFKTFDNNFSLTGGGPFRATEMIALDIYHTAYVYLDFSLAQAKGVVYLIVVLILSLLQVHFSKKREVEA